MKLLFFTIFLSAHIYAQTPIVATSDASVVTHKLIVGNVTIGVSDKGGGYVNYCSIDGNKNIVSSDYGKGWQGSVRDGLHSGRYNPTQAGFSDTAGVPVPIIKEANKLTIPSFNMPLYGDPVFDFTEHEDLVPDAAIYDDNNNSDTDWLEEGKLSQDDEIRSEFDFEGVYEDVTADIGAKIPVVRFYSQYTYKRKPKAILQFGKDAKLLSGGNVLKNFKRNTDVSTLLPGKQTPNNTDLSEIIFTAYGLRLLTSSGYNIPMWHQNGVWKTMDSKELLGKGVTKDFEMLSDQKNLTYPLLLLATGKTPKTSKAIGIYAPEKDINKHQLVGIGRNGEKVYKEDRRTRSVILFSRPIPKQIDIRVRYFITGMMAPERAKEDTVEALRNEVYILFGTPEEILETVKRLEVI